MYETRRKLLLLLKKGGLLSIDDLSRELGITTVAVRKHVSGLEKDGLVAMTLEHRPVGRPRYVYSLTDLSESLFPTSYPQLAVDLLDDIRRLYGEEEIRRLLKLRLERLLEDYSGRLRGATFAERVEEVAKLREDTGFIIDWEQQNDALIFTEYNCSIFQVAKKFPVVCEYELDLFRRLLGANITSSLCLARGDRMCQYIIKEI